MTPRRAPALVLVLLGSVSACETTPAPTCNETCDLALGGSVEATYVPYRWCDDVQSEADRIYGSYTCTSDTVDLRGEIITMTVEPYQDLEDSLQAVTLEVTECVEVVTWYIDVTFHSDAFAVHLPSAIEVYNQSDRDRTELFNETVPREDIEGWLLDGVDEAQHIYIFSRTDVGAPDKRWGVDIGDDDPMIQLSCE